MEPHTFWVDARACARETPAGRVRSELFETAQLPLGVPCTSAPPSGSAPTANDDFHHLRASLLAHQHHRWRDAEIPARPATGGAESTQTMGKVAAEMCSVTGASMPAELLRQTSVIHRFPTHAAHTGSIISSSLTAAFHCSPTNHDLLPRGTNRTISSHLLAQLAAPALPFWPSLARHEP